MSCFVGQKFDVDAVGDTALAERRTIRFADEGRDSGFLTGRFSREHQETEGQQQPDHPKPQRGWHAGPSPFDDENLPCDQIS